MQLTLETYLKNAGIRVGRYNMHDTNEILKKITEHNIQFIKLLLNQNIDNPIKNALCFNIPIKNALVSISFITFRNDYHMRY